MSDKVFLDTNLWIYLYSDKVKGRKVKQLVDERFENIVVSTQVLGELFHVLIKKGLKDKKEAKEIVSEIAGHFQVASISFPTVTRAISVHAKHGYSYWNSLIISSSLAAANYCTPKTCTATTSLRANSRSRILCKKPIHSSALKMARIF